MNIKTITSPEKCTGCAACANACSVQAITMAEDAIGHLFPSIDPAKCVNCAFCEKVCPSNRYHDMGNEPKITYAAWAKDQKEHNSSTSGGVAAVLARTVVEAGGAAYGCTCNPGGIISHQRIACVDNLWKLKGSKYVQSKIGLSYQQAKADLEQGTCVLFTGTPCQIAGLRSFLGQDYENLYTADLVCHGVPPQKLLFEHLQAQGISRDTVDQVRFREGAEYYLSALSKDVILYRKHEFQDLYCAGFTDCLYSRASCANCQYARKARMGDVTLSDFHQLGVTEPFAFPENRSISSLLINTDKGNEIIRQCGDRLNLTQRTFEEAQNGNPQLVHPAYRRGNYDAFVERYKRYGFEKAARKTLRIRRCKNLILRIMRTVQSKKNGG